MGYETLANNRNNVVGRFFWSGCAMLLVVIIALECSILSSCQKSDGNSDVNPAITSSPENKEKEETASTPEPTKEPEPTPYVYINESMNTIATRFNPPEGYTRVEVSDTSFGAFLRNYSLKKYGEKVYVYTGFIDDDTPSLAVVNQGAELSSTQQCADTLMMFWAEYLFSQKRYDEISFDFVNGFKCDFKTWASGKRVALSNNGKTVSWVDKKGTEGVKENDYTIENLYDYLQCVYSYSNTDSLIQQYTNSKKDVKDLEPGDVFIASAYMLKQQASAQGLDSSTISYGHAMIVCDVAVDKDGNKVFMLLEGNTPAREPYVVEDPQNPGYMWFSFDENGGFVKSTSGIKWQSTWIYSFSK